MQYSTLPNTDVTVSAIGLGTYALGGTYGVRGEQELRETVARALDYGITFFDTAPIYGAEPGAAERLLGELLTACRSEVAIWHQLP